MSFKLVQDIIKIKADTRVFTITPEASVYEAAETMSSLNVGALLVCQDDEILGIISERDFARRVILEDRWSRHTAVEDVMTQDVLFVTPTETLENCTALMTEKRVRHLPVVDGSALVGIISVGDIMKASLSDKDFLIEQLTAYVSGEHLIRPKAAFANR